MRLLIVRLSSMGDVIHALPLASNAARAGATVAWVVEPPFAGLLDGNPHLSRVFLADTRSWRRRPFSTATWREAAAVRRALSEFAPARTIDVQGLWKSAILARAAGAPVVGFAGAERRERFSSLLCDVPVRPAASARHVVDRNLALLPPVAVPVVDRAPDARYLLARPSAEAAAFLAQLPARFALYHPGARRPEKAWGEERFARLARALAERKGVAPVVSWGPGDEARAERLAALLPGAPRIPPLGVGGLAHIVAAGALFAGGDTGPLHLADALGATTLALFGPTDPERNGPYRSAEATVRSMRDIGDREVLARAEALLEARERRGARRNGS